MHRLCDVRFTTVRAKINLQDVSINGRNGDFNPTSLAQVVNTDTMNNVVVKSWIDRACTFYDLTMLSRPDDHLHSITEVDPCVLRQCRPRERAYTDFPQIWHRRPLPLC